MSISANKIAAVLAAILLFCAVAIGAQSQNPNDIDSLFNSPPASSGTSGSDNGTGTGAAAAQQSGQTPATPPQNGQPPVTPPQSGALRPDDITLDKSMHLFGTLDIYGLLGVGWSRLPDPANPEDGLGNEGSGSLAASLGFEIRPTPELRLSATMGYNFPKIGTQLSELIVDYSVLNSVFFRLGIFDYTWGNSQFFQFSNLPARSLPDWGVSNEPLWQQTNIITKTPQTVLPVSLKTDVPIGLTNLTFLARFDMANYGFPDATTPDPKDAGYGLRYDFVTGPMEWSVAGFWQHLLNPRTSLGLKTNVMGYDLSLESTLGFPVTLLSRGARWNDTPGGGIPVGAGKRIYPTFVVGISREWADPRIKVYAEYAFNGERGNGIDYLQDETGPGGHNTALVLRFARLGDSDFSLNMVWQQNWSDGSGLISPLLEISPAKLATLQFGPVLVYGPDNSEVINNRIVPGNKRLEFLLLLKIRESYRQ